MYVQIVSISTLLLRVRDVELCVFEPCVSNVLLEISVLDESDGAATD